MLTFIDLFAGAGGLSEGFIRAGFEPIAHVEMNKAACNTLRTRMAYHWLKNNNQMDIYHQYLNNQITREQFYSTIPESILKTVINRQINTENFNSIVEEINTLKKNKQIDLIIGGPPCQAYSLIGRARDKDRMQNDHRNYLFEQYASFLEEYTPLFFVFENVTGLLSAKSKDGEKYLEKMLSLFREKGYFTKYEILNANAFGVLQTRKRIVLFGSRQENIDFFPLTPKHKIKEKTVAVLFQDLPKLSAGEGNFWKTPLKKKPDKYLHEAKIRNGHGWTTLHIARNHTPQDKKIYKIAVNKWEKKGERLQYSSLPEELQTHRNKIIFNDRFKVVADNLPFSHTVVAHIAKDGHFYIHPDIKQNRSLTPREAARLQSFPDDYFFESVNEKPGIYPAFLQIGNAVPVLMGEALAERIMEII